MDIERLISYPLSVVAGKHLHFEGFALCFVCHLMPVIFVRLYLVTFAPEDENVLPLIARLKQSGIEVSYVAPELSQ